jgi:hypothetical protein
MHLCHLAMLCQFPASFFRSLAELISAHSDIEPEAAIELALKDLMPSGSSEAG